MNAGAGSEQTTPTEQPEPTEESASSELVRRRQRNAERVADMTERAADEASRALEAAREWIDNVREEAEQRVGSGDTDAVLEDPVYTAALEALRTVEAFCSATEGSSTEIRNVVITTGTGGVSDAGIQAVDR